MSFLVLIFLEKKKKKACLKQGFFSRRGMNFLFYANIRLSSKKDMISEEQGCSVKPEFTDLGLNQPS